MNIVDNGYLRFGDWLYDEYVKWRGNTTRSQTDFAYYLGIKQGALAKMMRVRDQYPSVETIRKIEKRLPHIHSVLFSTKAPIEASLETLQEVIYEALSECERQRIHPTSPEGVSLIVAVFKKHGVTPISNG